MRQFPVPDSCCNMTYINSVKNDPKYPEFLTISADLCGIINITDIKDFNEKSVYQNGCLQQVEGAIEKHLGQVAGKLPCKRANCICSWRANGSDRTQA